MSHELQAAGPMLIVHVWFPVSQHAHCSHHLLPNQYVTVEAEHTTQALTQALPNAGTKPAPHHVQQVMLAQRNGTNMDLVSENLEHMVSMHALTTLLK